MQLHELRIKYHRKKKKRVGRGNASGKGTYSGRGVKGAESRSGYSRRAGFEGGEMSFIQQSPKLRGKRSAIKTKQRQIINIFDLEKKFKDGEIVNQKTLLERGLISSKRKDIKLLGMGEIKKSLKVYLPFISESAKKKIEKAGGKVIKPKIQSSNVKSNPNIK